MLEPGSVPDRIDVTEIEQACSNNGAHPAIPVPVCNPDGARLAIGEIDRIGGEAQPHGLRKGRRSVRVIVQRLGAAAGVHHRRAGVDIHAPQLVGASHGDIQPARVMCQVPGRVHDTRNSVRRRPRLHASAGYRSGAASRHVNGAKCMIPGVRDEENFLVKCQPLRIVEKRMGTIAKAHGAVAHDAIDSHSCGRRLNGSNDHPVMSAICDGNAITVDRDLSGKRQHIRRRTGRVSRKHYLSHIKRSGRARIIKHTVEEGSNQLGLELSSMHAYHIATGADGHERWPCANGVGAPHAKLPVVDRGMYGIQAQAGVAEARRIAFCRKLSTVYAHDGYFSPVFLFERPQLRKHVDAVDSAVRPEIEQQEPSAKICQGELPSAGVDPFEGG